MKTMMKLGLCLPLVLGAAALLGLASWGCYENNCDPIKDENCPCPPGVCGEYPTAEAGVEGGDQ